jgi:hypothetical protein
MNLKISVLQFAITTLAASITHVPAAHAAFLNSAAPGVCHATSGTNGSPTYLFGIGNNGLGNIGVNCTVLRSELPAAQTIGAFYVDGINQYPNATTQCTLFSYNYDGTLLGGSAFTVGGKFDEYVTLPAAQLPAYAYVILTCDLPPLTTLYGVTSLQ